MGMLVEDEKCRVELANDLFCQLFKLYESPQLLKGIDSNLLMNNHFKHLFKDSEGFVSRVQTLIKEKQLVQNDLLELLDGRIFSRDYIPIYHQGTYKGHLWKYNDITAQKNAEDSLKRSEEKYRSIIANMKLGLMEVDIFERIVFANQSFCDMCGYDLDELIGKKASELFAKNEHIELLESKNEARQRPRGDAYEIAVKNKNGEIRWWLVSGAPRYSQEGDLIGSIGIHLDITEHKQLEIDLIKAREVAEESTKSKEMFLANMSHEIRTPMNAILGMSNQLAKTNLTAAQQFCLETINSASENLLVIINDILDLSKIESGKLSLEKIGFEPREVIKRAMQVLQHRAEEKGLSFTQRMEDTELAPVLIGDPYRINQILLNIISNAIKFTEKGTVEVSCKVFENKTHSQALQISVNDTGIGMDEHFMHNLFQKFSQEDASVTRQYGGTGLGMSICKDLIGLMGGDITVQSKKGTGTTISFIIEFAKGDQNDLPSKEAFKANEGMLAMKKILVVDDNEMNRLVATTILKSYGAVTVEAGTGKEAVEMLSKGLCDLVLMDIQMPIMNGFEATTFIRQHISKSLPIIALTANAIKGDNIKCFEAGMNAYVAKPFKEEDLMKTVATQLKIINQINTNIMESNQAPAETYYDITDIKTISRGNQDFINKMLKMFVDQTPGHIEEMKLRYEAKDYVKLGEVAHKIKPTIDSMGINSIKNTIREVEKIGKNGSDSHLLPDLLRQVEYALTMAIKAIKKDYQLS
jgi:PAS domain S-box-containing protein